MVKQDRLRARDISESLGKLPPQAPEMEESVLGAILLEKEALGKISHFLHEEHFYDDRHKEIYKAAVDLTTAGAPVDMRTVVNQLRKTGKLELVGNSLYIADLTAKVSSSENIETHARVIVEMAVKRFTIQVASHLQNVAYENTSDAFDLLDLGLAQIQSIKDKSLRETNELKIKALWEQLLITERPADDQVLISIFGTPVCTTNNHTLVLGKKKSRKTFFIILLISWGLQAGTITIEDIILFDTEQGKSDVYLIRETLFRMTGYWVPVFYLRGQSPAERQDFIEGTVRYWPTRPRLIVIDGIRDLMSNINDPDESTSLITWIEKLTLQHGLHVIDILHLNKTDGNARGHIGTELLNKAWMTIELELDEKTGYTIVKCESSRKKPFESFEFRHGADDLPEVIGTVQKASDATETDKRTRLIGAFDGQSLSYKDLVPQIITHFSNPDKRQIGINRAQSMVAEFIRKGWIIKTGKDRDPKTVYRLMISEPAQKETSPPVGPPDEDAVECPF